MALWVHFCFCFVCLFVFDVQFQCVITVSNGRRSRTEQYYSSTAFSMAASNPRWCSVEAVVELCQWLPAHAAIWGVVKQNALVTLHWHCVAAKHEVELNQHGRCQV